MRGGARVLLVARTSGRIAGALMAVVERVITPPPDDADAALIAAEQERYYLRAATGAWCARCKDDVDKCPEYPRADALREFIATAPAEGLAGAAVKLRQLTDPELGLPIGTPVHLETTLNQVRVAVERVTGHASHATPETLETAGDVTAPAKSVAPKTAHA